MKRRYRTIVADPPWKLGTDLLRPSKQHDLTRFLWRYDQMPLAAICALDVEAYAANNAHLYLWFVPSAGEQAYAVARAWGFVPKTILTWDKTTIGIGYYFRNNGEHVLFAVRGALRPKMRNEPSIFRARRVGHSVRPDAFFDLARRNSPGPYLELFARKPRDGWSMWGNEVKSDVVIGVR